MIESIKSIKSIKALTTRASPTLLFALFGIWIVWGCMYFFTRIAVQAVSPYLLAGTRFAVAGGLLFVFARVRGEPFPPRKQWAHSGLISLFMIVFGTGSTFFAQRWNTSSLAAALAATATIWIALLSSLRGKSPKRAEWLGIGIGFVGVLVLNADRLFVTQASLWGPLLGLLGALSWSIGSVLTPVFDLPNGMMRTSAQMLIGGSVLIVLSRVIGESWPVSLPWPVLGAWAVIVCGGIIGYSSYVYLLSQSRVALATSYAYVNPVIALILGVFVAHETVTRLELLGLLIVIGAVVLIWRASQK